MPRGAPAGDAPRALPRIALAALPREARRLEAARLASLHAAWRFDLARGPLLAAALLRLEEDRHHLLLAMHHIVSDGWSMGVLIREVAALYGAFAEGRPSPLPELPLQYPDFALWQRETAAALRERDLAWWSERLSGQTAPLDLPADRPRPAVQTWRGGWVIRTLPADLSDRLRSFGQAEGATLFMTMLAGVKALLHRLAGSDNVVVGSPIAGRRMAETEPLIGFFLNLLALRTDVSGDPGFRELVARVREVTLGAYAHQDLPFEALLARLQPERDLSRTPLFQVLFNLLNFPLTEERLAGLAIEAISLPDLPSKFDLTFYVRDDPGQGIAVRMAYNADLFDAVRMEELVDQLALLLAEGVESPELGVDRISLAATPRARSVLPDPAAELSAAWEGAVHEVFAREARRAPQALAAADPAESWTYGELDLRSDRLAAFLQAGGVRPGDVVAFWAHRSAPLVWGVLGAQKAGAAFLMLDPRYPAPRQAQMLGIARPAAWLRVAAAGPVPAEIESALDAIGCACRLTLPARAEDPDFLADGPAEPTAVEVGPDDVAYVAFTSGSTGVPKGVLGRHGSLSHFIPWLRRRFELSEADRFSMLSGLAHDPLHRDLFTPLQIGAAVVIPDPETMDEPGRLATWMRREGVTVAHLTPALGQVLTTEAPNRPRVEVPSLRYAFLVGDVLTRRDVARLRRLAPAVTCVNYYGSTETQRAVGYHVAEEDGPREILPLGRGIPDVQILVLNPAGALAGIGELGEVSIRSPHIALGYLGDPQLTAERFMADRYRTGDLGRYLPNGEAVFVGRADTQVKIRGFRIELGEIESVLGGFPGVREAVVIARQDRGAELYLAAYVVPAAGAALAARELRAFLRERLPDSMVPATFTLLPELPLTPNRKVDRKALPAPDRGEENAAFVPPETDLEREIAAVWQEVLGVDRVGVHDNFFEIGGHSLLLVRLLSRLQEALKADLSLMDLFSHPNVHAQAEHLRGRGARERRDALPARRSPAPASGRIAIVGLAGRFPGARDLEAFWQNLREGVESVSFFSREELLESGVPLELLKNPSYVPARAVVDGEDLFDAAFFEASPRQAELMDPQLRFFLETSWHALESAGIDPERFPGAIGIYGGVTASSYLLSNLLSHPGLLQEIGAGPLLLGTDRDFLTTQVSYRLGLRGPSVDVQTACSTSLVATHLACQALLTGDCEVALAGGVSIKVPQRAGYVYQESGPDSSDGHCRAFDAKADGSIYGAGVGLVVLKRLEDAIADGDVIHAVILGTAINNDGSQKVGYTAPSIEGQAAVVASALARAGVEPETIDYVECHGSGTALGDPIEVTALTRAFGDTGKNGFCAIGSVKTNIGHLGAAAGVTGLIKTVLALEHREIPPSLNFETPNPKIGFAGSPFRVNDRLSPWPDDGGPRRAGVSSLGQGGTNAHVVLEEAPAREPSGPSRPWQLLVLSARTATALEAATGNLAAWLKKNPDASLADTAFTLQVGRRAFAHRRAVVCRDVDEARRILEERDPRRLLAGAQDGGRRPVAFLLAGVGDHYPGMARGLYETEPVFRAALDRCFEILADGPWRDLREAVFAGGERAAEGGLDLRRMLGRGDGPDEAARRLHRTLYAQPAVFAVEHALAQLWMSWGVEPEALLGYSLGEYVAACLAGVFPLEDALPLVAERARWIEELPAGSMLAVPLPEAEVRGRLSPGLDLAAVNGPRLCVVSGPPEEVAALARLLSEEGIPARQLPTTHAFHSRGMEPLADRLTEQVRRLRPAPPRIPLLSNVTGTWLTAEEATDPAYWARHLCGPVRFSDGLAELWKNPSRALLEVGPGQGLSALALQHPAAGRGRTALPSLPHAHERQDDAAFALGTLGRLWLAGVAIDPAGLWREERRHRLELPLYPFERRRFWVEASQSERRLEPAILSSTLEEEQTPAPAPPALPLHARPSLPQPWVAPRNPTETWIAGQIERLLGIAGVGVHDSFFELGGHSLLGTQLLSRLRDELGIELPIAALFESPTPAELAARIETARGGATEAAPPIERLPRTGLPADLPLSFAQERLWFLDQLQPGSAAYNIPTALRLEGPLDGAALASALTEVARRHETLRTTFPAIDGVPVQRISPPGPFPLAVVDLTGLPEEAREAEGARLAVEEPRAPFDLASGPLARASLVRLGERGHLLLATQHHIVSDGWSLGLFVREVASLYRAFANGQVPELPELPVQYADFADWQRRRLSGPVLEGQVAWWRERLTPPPPVLELPADRPRPAAETFRGGRQPLAVPAELTAALAALGREQGATLFMTLLTGFAALLGRLTDQEDVAVGSPIAGRTRGEVENLIGLFINTLVLRADLSGDPTFLETLTRVRETALGAYAHQELPFERLVEELRPERSLGHSPLFQVLFILQNLPAEEAGASGLTLRPLDDVYHGVSRFDLTLSATEIEGGLRGYLESKTDLFDAATAARWLGHLGTLLAAAVAEPGRRLSELPVLSEAERRQILEDWNDTSAEVPAASVHHLIAERAARSPEDVAVVYEGERLTRAELEDRAALLAGRLCALGIGPESLVGIALERSLDLLVATLGVWKAGGAYLPLDPGYPAERIGFMLADSGVRVVLTHERLAATLPAHGARVLCLDRETDRAVEPVNDGGAGPDSLAYVLYTSGSTGRPKGVQVTHGALANFLASMLREPGLAESDVLLAVTSLSFDIAGLELYLPLLAGARLEIASAELAADGARLAARMRESGVTVLQATPATWRMLLEAGWEGGLRSALCGGEALPGDLAASLLRRAEAVWNLYGPTETTVWSAAFRAGEGAAGIVPIGRPIANTQIYALDRRLDPLPPGVPGEAWIGGAGVARGYLGRPDLTAERFRPDPFSEAPGARLYRTGDLVRSRPDGTFEFLGRADHQVKIRGHRIELGEIEAALGLHPGVAQAAVVARDDWGDRRLVAYVVPAAGQEARTAELRAFLRERLPEFMEPSAFVTLAALPLTPNRKVDRRALPAPEAAAAAGAYVAPRNPVEEVLAGLWAEVLGVERVGIDDDFFSLGGHSLLATRIASRVARVLGTPPPVRWIFERPTVRGLGDRIAQAANDSGREPEPPIAPVPRTGDLPLSFAQERLWFLDRFQPGGTAYNMPVALRLEGDLDLPALAGALAEIVRRHESLRTAFPERDGRPRQEIAPPAPVPLPVLDLSGLPAGRRDAELALRLAAEVRRPFDLHRGPLLYATLLRLGARDHALALATHHIVGDAWSIGIFVRELSTLYAVAARGERSPLPELPVQYADFAAWQRRWLTGERLGRLAAAWRARLEGAPAALELSTDRPHPPAQTFRGGSIGVRLRRELASGIEAFTRREGASLFMTLLAAFQTLLHRYSGQEDLVVGTPIAGRSRPEIEGLIGVFLNALALRGDLQGDPSFREMLARAREAALEAYALEDLPFETLLTELQPPRDLSRPPLFQTMLILQNAPAEALTLQGLGFTLLPVETGTAKLELLLSLGEGGGEIGGYLEYNADLFDRSTGGRLARHFETLLAGAVENPEARLSELPLLSPGEREQLVLGWNHTAAPLPAAPVHELFEAQADLTPGATAVLAGNERLTFAELDARANRLAHHLRGLGVGPEVLVGLSVERSAAMVVALLGILKAGGAYLPLDPSYPRERLAYMLADSGARVVVTEEALLESLPPYAATTVLLDGDAEEIARRPAERPGDAPDPGGLAYVLYTSGSTGRPKGVQVPHSALVNFLLSMRERPGMTGGDVLVAVTSLSFDIAGLEIYLPLLTSARLVVATREEAQDGARLRDLLARSGATVLQATPATWRLLIDSGWTGTPGLKALCGGEALPEDLAAALLTRSAAVWNLYGPTETTIWSTVCQVLPRRTVSIGRPIANTTAHLLDARGSLVPVGVPGELLLGGAGVTRGYLGRPDLTAGRFVPDPFGEPGGRLYRTGDLVRRRPDGELESLGRLDHQVKVRGFRIELGEIEAALCSHAAVAQAVAGVRDLREGKALVAWVVPAGDAGSVEPAELREHLRARLPEHMLPNAWVALAALPLTPNGKIDRRALPNPERAPAAVYEPPRSALERVIAEAWQELLGVEKVGLHDNFFELGGHSLLIPRLQARLREGLGREVGVVDLFGHPTVASLARRLSPLPPDSAAGETRASTEPRASRARRRGTGTEVAILAMAGRFPRAAGLEQFWRNLRDGIEAITFFSEEELAALGIPGELLQSPSFVRAGAVLENAELFDAELFGILPGEAELIDPQQRLLLECAWEALETAGYAGTKRPVGVFAGTSENTYLLHNLLPNPEILSSAGVLGLTMASSRDFVATRLAYKLDLGGPAISVQTACSTSLVAVHMACQSLLSGECELALAGGSSVRVPQRTGYTWQPGGISSPDGHCRAFDARAQGTVPGQGTGVVVLKLLEDALADGDPILAVIKGSAINNDGALKAGFTAPSPEGQAQVIRAAQLQAGVDPATIGFVEAHGTATPLGDPIEAAALTRAFGLGTDRRGFCALGSVKTNIGHLDAAAGVAGLIKAVLSLEHREIPPSLHFEAPNPEIDFAASPFYVNTEPIPWPRPAGTPRRAGVSSFGLGGTNAHVVLEEAPPAEPSGPSRPWQLLLLSAGTPTALERATDDLAGHLTAPPEQSLADVAWTLQVGRKTFRHRRALVAEGADEATALLSGRDPKRVWTMAGERGAPPVAFLLPGVGDQYAGMARGLYEGEPVFREELDRCAGILLPLLGLDLREPLLKEAPAAGGGGVDLRAMLRRGAPRPESPLHTTRVAQPAMLALGWSLARLWTSWGVRPQALLGYSLGEYTAACLAGVMTIEDGLTLAARRAELIERLPAGAMLAVPLPEAEVAALLPPALSLAAVNAPSVSVVSGPAGAVEDLEVRLAAGGLPCRRLGTAHAFHSREMEPIAGDFRELLRSVRLAPPRIPYLSNVTGTWIAPAQATDPGYWVEHLLRTVRFADGVAELWREPGRVLLEMGPGQALASLAAQQGGAQGLALASLPHEMDGRPAQQVLLGALGQLWLAGAEIDWEGFRGEERRRRVALPAYPFERKRFWIEPRPAAQSPRAEDPAALPAAGRLPEMADWFHAPLWKPSVRPAKNGVGTGRWLLLADELGVGAELALRLRAEGLEAETVPAGDPEALERALERSPSRIVHLRTLGNGADGDVRDLGFHGLLALARALGRGAGAGSAESPVTLDIVTDGLFRVDRGDRLQPGKALLLGPVRVIPQEYPGLRCRALDVDLAERRNDLIAQLLTELQGGGTEPLVAWRGRQRFVPGWEPVRLAGGEGSPFRENGAYLITGGTGGIGLALAGHLARTVRARLALVSRRGLPDGSAEVRELEAAGAEVLVLRADVADEEQMRRAVAAARDRFGSLHGVFHAAGVPGAGLIQLKSREAADAVLAPKVDGTRVLQAVLADVLGDAPPEILVLFSSINSVTGGLGQVDYCAANAYLDAVAESGLGPLPSVAVDWCEWKWDAWTEGTLADPRLVAGLRQQREVYGLGFEEGMEALERILASGLSRVVVSTRDLRAVLAQRHSLPEVLGGLDQLAGTRSGRATRPRPNLPVPYAAPEIEDHSRLAALWRELLGLEEIGIHDDFFQLGGHSLLGLQLLSRLQAAFGVEVPLRTLFDAPTIAELSVALHDLRIRQGPQTAAAEKIAALDPQSLLENLQELSDEEMNELLARMAAQEDSRT
ncbi:MAG TPA: amino acid adenylation domain-containing protein [Thermoanaerobaculia bacterium]|nr:amino acid adenylation domain-containing protein [Thermoanaerobaculia bacterium]